MPDSKITKSMHNIVSTKFQILVTYVGNISFILYKTEFFYFTIY